MHRGALLPVHSPSTRKMPKGAGEAHSEYRSGTRASEQEVGPLKSRVYLNDDMAAMPSEQELNVEEIGALVRKFCG